MKVDVEYMIYNVHKTFVYIHHPLSGHSDMQTTKHLSSKKESISIHFKGL
jgi:hypothetical protein